MISVLVCCFNPALLPKTWPLTNLAMLQPKLCEIAKIASPSARYIGLHVIQKVRLRPQTTLFTSAISRRREGVYCQMRKRKSHIGAAGKIGAGEAYRDCIATRH